MTGSVIFSLADRKKKKKLFLRNFLTGTSFDRAGAVIKGTYLSNHK